MAGSNYVLDKAWPVLSTYNSSAAGGVTPFRCVKLGTSNAVDLNTAAATFTVGIIQDTLDQAKIALGKTYAEVRMLGISKAFVAASGTVPVVGDKVTAGAGGGVVKAATGGTNFIIGVVVGPILTTIAAGDLIDVLVTINGSVVP